MKISQNWLKFLGCTQDFGVLHLKCKNVTKKLIFAKLFVSFLVQNALKEIFGFSVKSIILIKKYKKRN